MREVLLAAVAGLDGEATRNQGRGVERQRAGRGCAAVSTCLTREHIRSREHTIREHMLIPRHVTGGVNVCGRVPRLLGATWHACMHACMYVCK